MKQHTSILALALAGTLLVCSGCSQGEKIPASPVELTACSGERVDGSQSINLPEGWQVTQAGDIIIAQQEEDIPEQRQDATPYTIQIVCDPSHTWEGTDSQQIFTGDTQVFEDQINSSLESQYQLEQLMSDDEETSALDYLNLLTLGDPENPPDRVHWVTNTLYQGKHGLIAALEFEYEFMGKTYHEIHCYRQDMLCTVMGGFDDNLELSSGDFALQTADSLTVEVP